MNETLANLIKNSFGFDPQESQHHFVVDIPRSGDAPIKVSEHLTWDAEVGSSSVTSRRSKVARTKASRLPSGDHVGR